MSNKTAFNIQKVTTLARLNLADNEKKRLEADLQNIITYVDKLNELNTENIEATSHVLNIENIFRKDAVAHTHSADEVLKVLPDSRKDGKFFKVPKVIEES
ncbi:MAG: Asp-tRNA(Asn)/Glu-tRNA(Gln) amidotransferase subunit GatC [Candidatus Omnitrophica bacterium]|nr:Asp-tRNA(Asn)/Glu-tRNA(Gln) amidotransferase subunit GatC [Candidatus Omnitrophota bacterium]